MKLSLRKKLTLSTALLILFFGSVSTYYVYNSAHKTIEDNETNNLILNTKEKAEKISIQLNNAHLVSQTIAQQEYIKNFLIDQDHEDKDHILEHLNSYNIGGFFSSIYVIDTNGLTLASTDNSFEGKNYKFREYFKQAVDGKSWSDVLVGVTSNELGYYFSVPVYNDRQEILGVVVSKLKPDAIHRSIKNLDDTSLTYSILTDRYGVVIFSDFQDKIYKSLGKISASEKLAIEQEQKYSNLEIKELEYDKIQDELKDITNVQTYKFFDKTDNREELIAVAKVNNFMFFVLVEEDLSKFNNAALRIALSLSLFVFAAAMAAIITIYLVLGLLMKPLSELSELAENIAGSDPNEVLRKISFQDVDTFKNKGSDQIGHLYRSFYKMLQAIKESRSEISIKVAEQTKEIQERERQAQKQQKAVLNVLEDVETEKNRAESLAEDLKKFELAIEQASDHIVITDADGIVIFANKAVERITGFSKKEVIGKKAGCKKLWGGRMGLNVYKKLWKTIKIEKKSYEGEFNNVRKNGEEYVAKANVSPVLDKNGEVKFFVGIERDVTKERDVDRMKTDFISLASHQLRTPLSAMKWFLEMLLDADAGKLNKEQKEYVQNVFDSNERMIALVNSLLNISRIESGRIIIDPQLTDLSSLIKQLIKELDQKFKKKKQTISLEIQDSLPKANLDPKLIRNVYLNLLTNAIKYSKENSKIEIKVKKKDDEIISQVIDHGIGIPEKEQKKIFGRFFRATNVVKLDTDGNGLGLYMVKAIVESSGGKVWFESKEGKGSKFYFSLPIKGVKPKKGEVSLTDVSY